MSDLIPHFALPFRIVGGVPAVVDQDTPEEIRDCVEAIVRTPQGSRVELPDFGVPDQSFQQGGADAGPIATAVEEWEPRAAAAATADNSSLADYITSILIDVTGGA